MVRPLYLDRELCFKKWAEMGKLENVSRWLAEQGIVNPKTKKPFSLAAISYAARRWVCLHPEEARTYFNRAGWYPNDDDWNRWLISCAVKVFHSHKRDVIVQILDENRLRDEYGHIIGEGASASTSY
jgi:hypothetical protein